MWGEMSYNWYVSEDTEPEVWDDEYEPTERDWALWIYGNSENELEVIFEPTDANLFAFSGHVMFL